MNDGWTSEVLEVFFTGIAFPSVAISSLPNRGVSGVRGGVGSGVRRVRIAGIAGIGVAGRNSCNTTFKRIRDENFELKPANRQAGNGMRQIKTYREQRERRIPSRPRRVSLQLGNHQQNDC